ncbi:MAG: hypothetical protein O2973_02530 [Gemmatimonadetes bacterium]|nr:hypothetical protein [Gemmatimonadota bacterium]
MRPLTALVLSLALAACSGNVSDSASQPPSADQSLAAAAAGKTLPPEQYVSPTAGFDLTLPGVWTGRYRTEEKRDTTAGARLGVVFSFVPDSGSAAPSLTLMTLRIFTKSAWATVATRTSSPVGTVLAERGDDVFVLSLPNVNPYPPASPEAPLYDQLIISIAQGGQQVHLTPR